MGEREINCHPEPYLSGEVQGWENDLAMLLHDGAHFFQVLFGHLVYLHAGQIGHEGAVLFLGGVFGAAQGVFAFPNQLPPAKTGPKAVVSVRTAGITAVDAAVIPFLLQKDGACLFDQILINEIVIFADEQIGVEPGLGHPVPPQHHAANETEGGLAVVDMVDGFLEGVEGYNAGSGLFGYVAGQLLPAAGRNIDDPAAAHGGVMGFHGIVEGLDQLRMDGIVAVDKE